MSCSHALPVEASLRRLLLDITCSQRVRGVDGRVSGATDHGDAKGLQRTVLL